MNAYKAHQRGIEVECIATVVEAHAKEGMALGGWVFNAQDVVPGAVAGVPGTPCADPLPAEGSACARPRATRIPGGRGPGSGTGHPLSA